MVNSAGEAACEVRRTSKDEACEVGTAARVRAAAISRAAEVNDEKSRFSADAYNRSDSRGGKRTVASSCADSRLGGLPACTCSSGLSRRLRVGVDDAIFKGEKCHARLLRLDIKSSVRLLVSDKDTAPMLLVALGAIIFYY